MSVAHAVQTRKSGERSLAEKYAAKEAAWAQHTDLLETHHRLILGDARELTRHVREPVHLVVTSPPYWDLKEYAGDAGDAQLGHISGREGFLAELRKVWQACFDLIEPGGRLCIVVGDVCRSRRHHGRHLVEPLHAYLQVQCQDIGFDPLTPIVWSKIANATTEVAGNGGGFFGKPYEPNAIIKNDIEFILLFRKGGGYRHPTQEQRDLSLIERDDYHAWFRSIWSDVTGEPQREHPAPFPVEVARRLIGMFSFVGDTVLDPFCGTGNTIRAAMAQHRNSVGVEVEPTYASVARKRIGTPPLHATFEYKEPASQ